MSRIRVVARWAVEGGLYGLLFLPPLFFGGVEGWARGAIQIVAGAILLAHLLARRDEGRPAEVRRRAAALGVPAGLFLALVIFQLVPLPPSLLRVVSPGSHRLYSATIPGYAEGEPREASGLPSWLLERPRARALLGKEQAETAARKPDLEGTLFDERFSSWRSVSLVPHETARRLGLLLACLAVFVVAAGHFGTRQRIHRLAAAMVVSGLAAFLLTLGERRGWLAAEGPLGPFVNSNTYAAFLGGVLPVAVAMALVSFNERRAERGFLWSLASVLLAGAVLSSLSRAGIVSAGFSLAVLAALAFRHERRLATVAVLAALLVAGALLLLWLGPPEISERVATVSEGSSEPSMAHRIDVWRRATGIVGEYPGLGAGLGTFAHAFMPHAPPEETWWRDAHNEYLELLCDTGLVGGLLALAVLAGYLTLLVRPRRPFGGGERYLVIGLAPGLLALALHSSVSANLQVPAAGLLAATLAGALLAVAAGPGTAPAPSRAAGSRSLTARITVAALAVAVGLNTLWGLATIVGSLHREAGEKALARVEMDRALERLRAATFWQPGDARAHELIARAVQLSLAGGLPFPAARSDAPDDLLDFGLSAIAAAVERNPGNSRTWFALATLYQGRRARRQLDAAIAAVQGEGGREATALDPEDPVSIAAILQAQELQPGFTTYHDYLAGILMRAGMTGAASDQLRRSFSLRPRLEAHGLIDIDDEEFLEAHGDAIIEGIEAAGTDPYTPAVMAAKTRARILEKLGRHAEALEAYAEMRKIGGREFEAQFHLAFGRLDQKRGNYIDSIAKLKIAADAGRGTTEGAWALYHLGIATSRAGNHTTAIKYYRTFLSLMPDHVSAYTGLAGELDLVGRIEEAERLYREAVRRFPEEPHAYERLIAFLRRQSREEEAEPYLRELGRLAP